MRAERPSPHRLVVLLLVTSIALIAADRNDPDLFNAARRSTLEVTDPVRRGLEGAAEPVAGAWEGAVERDRLADENRALRTRLADLEGTDANRPSAEDELARLMAATDLDFIGTMDTVAAAVVVDRVTPTGHVIEIDRGTRHGVQTGMTVVTGRGLVGLVTVATGDRSVVQPITDSATRIGVRSSIDYGIVAGDGPDRPLVLQMDPRRGDEAGIGSRFLTSGLDRSLYPALVPVGEVVETAAGEVVLEPFVDFGHLGYVSVVLWQAR